MFSILLTILAKYFVGRRLSILCYEWLSLRDNSAPSAVFPTPFYEGCLDTLSRVDDSVLIPKVLYKKLMSLE